MNPTIKKELIKGMTDSLAESLSEFIDSYEGAYYAELEPYGKIGIYQDEYIDEPISKTPLIKAVTSYLDGCVDDTDMHEEDAADFIRMLEERKQWLADASKEMDRLIDIYKAKLPKR